MEGNRLKKAICGFVCAFVLAMPVYAGCSSAAVSSDLSTGYASYILTVNGVVLNTDSIQGMPSMYIENGNIMVPVRPVAEALDYSIRWDAVNRSITVEDENSEILLFVGDDGYSRSSKNAVSMTAPESLGAAPEIKNGYAFVPAKVFELMYCKVVEKANTVTISSLVDSSSESGVRLPNPVMEHATLSDAEEALGFSIKTPKALEKKTINSICSIFGILDIDYEGGIAYRMSLGAGQDISGDYTEYDTVKEINIAGYNVTVKEAESTAPYRDGKVMTAIFSDDTYSYSLSFSDGIEVSGLTPIIRSIDFTDQAV
jgi:hypothetical protein